MSLAIKTSRAEAMGDPGLFGAIGGATKGAIGGITGGPLGIIGGAISGGVRGGRGPQRRQPRAGQRPFIDPVLPGIGRRRGMGRRGFAQQQVPVRPKPGIRGGLERLIPGGATGFEVMLPGGNGMGPAPSGFHWNKSSYFLSDGTFVEIGAAAGSTLRRSLASATAKSFQPVSPRTMSPGLKSG